MAGMINPYEDDENPRKAPTSSVALPSIPRPGGVYNPPRLPAPVFRQPDPMTMSAGGGGNSRLGINWGGLLAAKQAEQTYRSDTDRLSAMTERHNAVTSRGLLEPRVEQLRADTALSGGKLEDLTMSRDLVRKLLEATEQADFWEMLGYGGAPNPDDILPLTLGSIGALGRR